MQDGSDSQRFDEFGQVLAFRRRPMPSPVRLPSAGPDDPEAPSLDDLAEYEVNRDDEPIDYRRRTLMNVIALAVVTILVGAGVWIADTITDLQRDQDCVLQGRGNCAPIEAAPSNRQ
jgi:hypothetical protein